MPKYDRARRKTWPLENYRSWRLVNVSGETKSKNLTKYSVMSVEMIDEALLSAKLRTTEEVRLNDVLEALPLIYDPSTKKLQVLKVLRNSVI